MNTISFRVYGTEFCRVLDAVRLFQAQPKTFATYAAVRCLSRHDGLSMAALNGVSVGMGNIATIEQEGFGAFSVPHRQVAEILGVFKVSLPKEVSAQEYVLELEVHDRHMTVTDVSGLINGSSLTVEIGDDPLTIEHGDKTPIDYVQQAFTALRRGLEPVEPADLTDGIYFSPAEVARIAKAAAALGLELHLRMIGRMLVAPLDDDFVAYTVSSGHLEDEDHKAPWIDERALRSWRGRLREVIDEGVI